MLKTRIATAAMVALVCGGGALGAVPFVATFDTDAQTFQGSTISTTQIYSAMNGNPGGHVILRRDLSPPAFDIGTRTQSIPEFTGSYAGITSAGFDINALNTPISSLWLRFRDSVNVNGWHFEFGNVAPGNVWLSRNAPINAAWTDGQAAAAGWVQEAGAPSFATLFGNVSWIEVRIDNPDGVSTLVGVDNVRIVPAPGAGAGALMLSMLALRRARRG